MGGGASAASEDTFGWSRQPACERGVSPVLSGGPVIELRTPGPLELLDGEGNPLDAVLVQLKRAALLVYVALAARDFVRRDALLGTFWPEHEEGKARNALRPALYQLRQDLGPDALVARGDDELAVNRDLVTCDVWALDDATDLAGLERSAGAYRGPFLTGFYLKGTPDFDHWVDVERDLDVRIGPQLQFANIHSVVTLGPSVSMDTFSREAWDFHPSADRFVVADRVVVDMGPERVVIVTNWLEELRRLVDDGR